MKTMLVLPTVSGEYEIETFDLGNGRSIEILASKDAEVVARLAPPIRRLITTQRSGN